MSTATSLLFLCVFFLSWQNINCDWQEDFKDFAGKEFAEIKTDVKEIKTTLEGLKKYKKCDLSKCPDAMYFKGGNILDYAYSEDVAGDSSTCKGDFKKPMDAMTACFWMKTKKSYDSPTVFSYATKKQDNVLAVYFQPDLKIVVKDKKKSGPYTPQSTGITLSDDEWHHICVAWESKKGTLKVYKDGIVQYSKFGYMTGEFIEPYGMWILGQDQDSYYGGFQLKDAYKGSLTGFNVWNKFLCEKEISFLAIGCSSAMEGNYKAYSEFTIEGGVTKFKPKCCH